MLYTMSNVLSLLTSVVLAAVLFIVACALAFSLYIFRQHWKYSHIPGPKRSSFLLGNVSVVARASKNGMTLHELMLEWTKEHGPVFVMFLMHRVIVVILDPLAVKYLLVTTNAQKPASGYSVFHSVYGERFLGRTLAVDTDPARWLRTREILNPVFHRKLLMNFIGQFNQSADLLIEKLKTVADGKTSVSMLDEFNKVTLDIIAKVAFGLNVNVLSDAEAEFSKHLHLCLATILRKILNPLEEYRPFIGRLRDQVRRSARYLRRTGQDEVERRLSALNRGQDSKNDLLGRMLEGSDYLRNPDMQMEDILDDFIGFFFGGQETTANELSFTLMELLRCPEIEHRVRTEIDSVLNGKTFVEYEDIGKLSYTSKVLKESLRLYPPIPRIMRENTKDEVFAGIMVPAHSPIMLSTYVMSRMEEFFEDPLVFNPDRFDETETKTMNMFAYFPFSLGPRNCIGKAFAEIEAKVILARLLTEFDFTWLPDQSYDILDLVTTRPKDGCQTYIKIRDK